MYLLFDIGGTKTRVALSRDGVSFEKPVIVPTSKSSIEGIQKLAEIANNLAGGEKMDALAGAIAGTFNRAHTQLVAGTNIPEWVGMPLADELSGAFGGARVFLENDAALAGLGEAVLGAGKGREIVAYITVSTGVGGARIVKGRIDSSAMGFEPEYQIIDLDGTYAPELKIRRLGRFISGGGIEERFHKPSAEIRDASVQDELAQLLAIGLNNTIVHWSPDIVILGGAVMNIIPVDRVRSYLKETLKPFPESPPVELAALGDLNGLYGALLYLKQQQK